MADEAMSPLDVMLTLMRQKWAEEKWDDAAQLAKSAAPFVHPRAAAAPPLRPLSMLRDDELGGWMEVDNVQGELLP